MCGSMARAGAQQRADQGPDPEAGVGGDQALGDAVRRGQEEPVVVRRGHGPGHVAEDVPGRHDVQDRQAGYGGRVIEDQPVRHPGAPVVADQLELTEAELAHEPDLVAGHGPLGVDQPGGVRGGLAGVAVAAQVGRHHRVVLGQDGRDVAPHEVILGIAVQEQQGRPRSGDGAVDRDALDVHLPVLKASQSRRFGHSHMVSAALVSGRWAVVPARGLAGGGGGRGALGEGGD